MARLTDKEFNRLITEFLGNPERNLRVSYRGGKKGWETQAGIATYNVNRVHLRPEWYKAIVNRRVSPDLVLGMGVLAHEVGHFTPASMDYVLRGGTPNATGGMDFDQRVPENAADEYAYANMRRLYNAMGFRPHLARRLAAKSIKRFRSFRAAHPY